MSKKTCFMPPVHMNQAGDMLSVFLEGIETKAVRDDACGRQVPVSGTKLQRQAGMPVLLDSNFFIIAEKVVTEG